MTAVNPTRLRFQIHGVMTYYGSPVQFQQKLAELFSLYANYALRLGESASTRPLIPTYNLPHPVLRQLKADLQPKITQNSEAALNNADQLWLDDYYEIKHIALWILGMIPTQDPQPIIDRLLLWLTPEEDQVIKEELISIGAQTLQEKFPAAWEAMVLRLLSINKPEMTALGIQCLAEGSKSPHFKNLPAIFRLASPLIRDPHVDYMRDLVNLIETLAALSPKETAFFLKQILSVTKSSLSGPSRETLRLIKDCLPAFPKDIQLDIKTALGS